MLGLQLNLDFGKNEANLGAGLARNLMHHEKDDTHTA
jgi:hypothetical protein